MHDRYLPTILMSSLPIIFKRTVSAPIVLQCEQRQLAAGVLSAKCFDAYCTKCHGADDIDTSPARSSRCGGSDRMKIDDAEGYIPPAPPDTPVAVSRVANVVAALAVVALVFLIAAFCVMADISISTTGAEEAGQQGSSTRLANLEKDW